MRTQFNYKKKGLYQILPILYVTNDKENVLLFGLGEKNLAFIFGSNISDSDIKINQNDKFRNGGQIQQIVPDTKKSNNYYYGNGLIQFIKKGLSFGGQKKQVDSNTSVAREYGGQKTSNNDSNNILIDDEIIGSDKVSQESKLSTGIINKDNPIVFKTAVLLGVIVIPLLLFYITKKRK